MSPLLSTPRRSELVERRVPNALQLLSRKSAEVRGLGVCVPRARAQRGSGRWGCQGKVPPEAVLLQCLHERGRETYLPLIVLCAVELFDLSVLPAPPPPKKNIVVHAQDKLLYFPHTCLKKGCALFLKAANQLPKTLPC